MKRTVLALSFFLSLIALQLQAQNDPAPQYLMNQNFPDSVLQMTFQSVGGEEATFAQILEGVKGKKVFVDIWASWCKDCVAGMPNLKKLQAQAEGEEVAFVFLSVDREETKWKQAIEKYNLVGDHYLISTGWHSPLTDYIVLDWIPRYFVLDENGEIVLSKAVKADDKKLQEVLLP
ncbi:TlpA family protein disulfide reductase [Reichenbachiella ulvae]|uniref:TlpA family protein disulfide reductase n=1 Tax=Reichenbachiella ulvae TaxID=2980104 RepID=A0ABT3D0C5_9BACT|nr:TlpA disulfide reductase family protein [Reichenbachiella ulvae]MCV9389342.1 TlpA family protein disulfide reductase [Reichenbachiella ulvae]